MLSLASAHQGKCQIFTKTPTYRKAYATTSVAQGCVQGTTQTPVEENPQALGSTTSIERTGDTSCARRALQVADVNQKFEVLVQSKHIGDSQRALHRHSDVDCVDIVDSDR